jgi:hypothetical protein
MMAKRTSPNIPSWHRKPMPIKPRKKTNNQKTHFSYSTPKLCGCTVAVTAFDRHPEKGKPD